MIVDDGVWRCQARLRKLATSQKRRQYVLYFLGRGICVILSAKPEGATVRLYGIFGIIGHNSRVPADMPERGTKSLAQRGPDDSGTVILHDAGRRGRRNRLRESPAAILDLSPFGHQFVGVDGQARSILEEARGGLVIEPENSAALVNAVCSLPRILN
jgi:hypothetical protein